MMTPEQIKLRVAIAEEALEDINVIMWESLMIKDKPFTRDEGKKIMIILEKWASKQEEILQKNK